MATVQTAFDWPAAAALVAVAAPLIAVPLTVLMFHLKSMREQHAARLDEFGRRLEAVDGSVGVACRALTEVQRDYTTKEEWLRENMATRHHVEHLIASVTRLETEIDVVRGWSQYLESRLRAAHPRRGPDRGEARPQQSERC